MGNHNQSGAEWIPSDDERVRAWFGSYARKTAVKTDHFHIDIVPGNHVIFVGDPNLPIPRFYGGGYPVSDDDTVEPHNLNRLLHGSTAHRKWLRLPNIFSLAVLFLARQNRDSFVGDLEERYGVILKATGRRAATIWFWREVGHSFLSLALDAVKNLSGFEKLIERYRRIGS